MQAIKKKIWINRGAIMMNDTGKNVVDKLKVNSLTRIATSNICLASCYGTFLFLYEIKFLREMVSVLHPILILWSVLVIGYNFFKYRKQRRNISQILLVTFVILAGITGILNYKTGIISNIKAWILAVIPLGVFYPMCILSEKEKMKKNFILSILFPSFVVFCGSLIALITYFLRISQTVSIGGIEELIGFRYYLSNDPSSGLLLYGIYIDTNHAAIYSLVFAGFSVYFFMCCRKKIFEHKSANRSGMIYAVINFILQICYFPLANSRGGWLSFAFGFAVIFFIYAYTKIFNGQGTVKKLYKSFLSMFICGTIVIGGLIVLRGVLVETANALEVHMNKNVQQIHVKQSEEKHANKASVEETQEEQEEKREEFVDADKDMVNNISIETETQIDNKTEKKDDTTDLFTKKDRGNGSGRLLIWKEALQLFQKRPIFGIAPGNSQYYAGKFGIGSEKVAIGFVLHNSYLDVLVDYGVIGFGVFISFLGVCAWKILKKTLKKQSVFETEDYIIMCMLLLMSAASFFLTCVFINVTAMYFLFLIMLGYLISYEEI